MRVTGSPRPGVPGRRTTVINVSWQGEGVGNHNFTQRAQYVVPSGKQAEVVAVYANLVLDTPGSNDGRVHAQLFIDASPALTCAPAAKLYENSARLACGGGGILSSGAICQIRTTNLDTSALWDYYVGMVFAEFNV